MRGAAQTHVPGLGDDRAVLQGAPAPPVPGSPVGEEPLHHLPRHQAVHLAQIHHLQVPVGADLHEPIVRVERVRVAPAPGDAVGEAACALHDDDREAPVDEREDLLNLVLCGAAKCGGRGGAGLEREAGAGEQSVGSRKQQTEQKPTGNVRSKPSRGLGAPRRR